MKYVASNDHRPRHSDREAVAYSLEAQAPEPTHRCAGFLFFEGELCQVQVPMDVRYCDSCAESIGGINEAVDQWSYDHYDPDLS